MASFVLIGIYANSPQIYRGKIWDSLIKKFDQPIILIGDINMVEFPKDRYMKHGQTISRSEKLAWNACKIHFNLVDIGTTGQFTWQNYGMGDLLRKAWFDRCYVSQELSTTFVTMDCQSLFDSCISDHYPICTNLTSDDKKNASKWFHTNHNLFNLPLVKEEMAKIWKHFFNIGITLARAWSLAVKSTQSLLICTRMGRQKIREQRKRSLSMQVETLEKRANSGNIRDQDALRDARVSLN